MYYKTGIVALTIDLQPFLDDSHNRPFRIIVEISRLQRN